MTISVALDELLRRKSMSAKELAQATGVTEANISLLRNGKVNGIRFSTLDAICVVLGCGPGDLLLFSPA